MATQPTQTEEFFVTSAGFAVGASYSTWAAAHAARVALAEEGVTELNIERYEFEHPGKPWAEEPQEMTHAWVRGMERNK